MTVTRLGLASVVSPEATDAAEAMPVLSVRGLVKEFPGTRALAGVDLDVRRGEIHALLGENGAGKSTLIKAICGVHMPTAGSILLDGHEVWPASPQQAQALGIAAVHQHSNLVPGLSVRENLLLGERLPRRFGGFIDWPAVDRRAAGLLGRVGLRIIPSVSVSDLRPDQVAMVSIAKAIVSDAKIIILDEPTSALLPHEVAVLFGHMRRLASEGHAFLYVSHRLTEVFEIADRVTVLRDGRVAGTWTRARMSRRAVVQAIVGGNPALSEESASPPPVLRDIVLAASDFGGGRVTSLSMELRGGEILGFAGLPGSGAEEALDLLYGRQRQERGSLSLDGKSQRFASPREAKRAGLALLPKDRIGESLLPMMSVRENISIPNLDGFISDPVLRFVRRGRERSAAVETARRLNVKAASIEAPIETLSGGNQQKAMLGRWVASGARVYLLSSPTAAVDVGAKAEIYELIRGIAADGGAVIFTSTEIEEFPRVCHRVLVFRDGVVVGELIGRDATENRIMQLAAGGADEP